eukprot:scaffold731_cov261-Pinguiococcus_pyrenoidosus.AAC.86
MMRSAAQSLAGSKVLVGALLMSLLVKSSARILRGGATGGAATRLFAAAAEVGSKEGTGQYKVEFRGQTVLVNHGELLRTSLLRRKLTPHNGQAKLINCRGLGTCGTCAVRIEGPVEPAEKNRYDDQTGQKLLEKETLRCNTKWNTAQRREASVVASSASRTRE